MVHINKVYTRGGDKGETSLADGSRVSKDDLRLRCYGTIDELNSLMGLVRETAKQDPALDKEASRSIDHWCQALQNDLFSIGSDLATPIDHRWEKQKIIGAEDVSAMEQLIDHCQAAITPLNHFIVPGGSLLNAQLHLARSVCRRAERWCVNLEKTTPINPEALRYINRLSDLLFVLARWSVAMVAGDEAAWESQDGIQSLAILHHDAWRA